MEDEDWRVPGPLDLMDRPMHEGDVIVWAARLTTSTDSVVLNKGLIERIDEREPLTRIFVRRMMGPNEVLDRATTTLTNLSGICLARCWHRVPAHWRQDKDYVWRAGHEPILSEPAAAGGTMSTQTAGGSPGDRRPTAAATTTAAAAANSGTAGPTGRRPGDWQAVGTSGRRSAAAGASAG